jgi:hypothetical protein
VLWNFVVLDHVLYPSAPSTSLTLNFAHSVTALSISSVVMAAAYVAKSGGGSFILSLAAWSGVVLPPLLHCSRLKLFFFWDYLPSRAWRFSQLG